MDTYEFKAIGTTWSVSVDGKTFTDHDRKALRTRVDEFEQRFSRFLPDTEVTAFKAANAGDYAISAELTAMLKVADHLRTLTEGVYDPALGELLEKAGYDAAYRLRPQENISESRLTHWSIKGTTLTIDGPVIFDLGSIGKGYCIDLAASFLRECGYAHFIVDAGGDMYGTRKADTSPWRVAIQYPGQPDTAAGVIDLRDQALAVSDSFRRRWGNWHHIINPKEKQPIRQVIGAAAVAPSAFFADCMTSILFLGTSDVYAKAAKEFNASYLVFSENGSCPKSNNWPGKVFV